MFPRQVILQLFTELSNASDLCSSSLRKLNFHSFLFLAHVVQLLRSLLAHITQHLGIPGPSRRLVWLQGWVFHGLTVSPLNVACPLCLKTPLQLGENALRTHVATGASFVCLVVRLAGGKRAYTHTGAYMHSR